ncbi:MAG: DUF4910 domain-containing protein [Alphaproteobacteria bacterium]|nr:DUF4910 domain-containing protein [Alphaproteobacteria bacterium]
MIAEIVADRLRRAPIDRAMAWIADLCRHDRYQASLGINRAAEFVADTARSVGVENVTIQRFAADGRRAWWSFDAPRSWTPVEARLEVKGKGRDAFTVDHAATPFTIATYSAATPPGGVTLPLVVLTETAKADPDRGGIAVVDRETYAAPDLIARVTASGCRGFVTDGPAKPADRRDSPGRVELPPGCPLFAFSITSDQFRRVRTAALSAGAATARIQIDRTAPMPVVIGTLPGDLPGEIWLTGHLCHPRPGANDNASGVAGTLAVAALEASFPRAKRKTLRFVWGPEFLGAAALLHSLSARGIRPEAVINLDMIGEDQALCGCPFVLERSSGHMPDPLSPLAELIVAEVFAQTNDAPGRWIATPFQGFSDHAIFVSAAEGCPAVQFCHAPDPFNHSAADRPDKVSPLEMRRSIAAASALATMIASSEDVAANRPTADLRTIPGDARPIRRDRGPVNIRAIVAALSPGSRERLLALFREDRMNHAVLMSLALRVDGVRGPRQIVEESYAALERPVEEKIGMQMLDALIEAGWAE